MQIRNIYFRIGTTLKEGAGNTIKVQQTKRNDVSSDLSILLRFHPASQSNKIQEALKLKEDKKRERKEGFMKGG